MKAGEESLSTASYLVSTTGGRRPPREHLKSAIGEAYYTVFHRLQSMCTDCFIGDEDDPNTPNKAWLARHRLLKHGMTQIAIPIKVTNSFLDIISYRRLEPRTWRRIFGNITASGDTSLIL